MVTGRFSRSLCFFMFLLQIQIHAHALHLSFANASPSHANLLQDVLKTISARHKWDLKDVNVSKLEVGKVRFGTFHTYAIRIGLGNSHLLLKFSDQVAHWNKFSTPISDLGSLIRKVSSMAVLDTFKLEGPFELRVHGLHQLSLYLPMNNSYTGLRHILVDEGITLEVRRAQEVSLFYSSGLDLHMNGGNMFSKGKSDFWPFQQSTCTPLIPIRISGSASLVAYRARKPHVHVEATFISEDTIELLPEKCYLGHIYKKRSCPIDFFSLRLSMLEKTLRSLQNQVFGILKANIKASAAVRFPLELEINVGSGSATLPDWRTRPSVERVWFEILARVEADGLKPLMIKKVKPFIESVSVSWGNLMSNMSFTKLQHALVPPEALTLDVKW